LTDLLILIGRVAPGVTAFMRSFAIG